MAVSLALLRAVDAARTDTFGVVIVQDFDDIAVENDDDRTSKLSGEGRVLQTIYGDKTSKAQIALLEQRPLLQRHTRRNSVRQTRRPIQRSLCQVIGQGQSRAAVHRVQFAQHLADRAVEHCVVA
jgi:hypothetical protein